MKNKFQYLTYAGYYIITSKNYHILIDPYLDQNDRIQIKTSDFERIDLILVTHGAFDHVGDTAKIAILHRCPVVCGDDVKMLLLDQGVAIEQIISTTWGLTVQVGEIKIKPIENHHRSCVTLSDGRIISSQPLAFIVYLEDGTRVYVSGDTALFSDMKLQGELYRPHIGLINVATESNFDFVPHYLTGEMSPYEAALASNWLGLDVAVACHYTTLKNPDVGAFLKAIETMTATGPSPTKAIALDAGEWYEYSAKE